MLFKDATEGRRIRQELARGVRDLRAADRRPAFQLVLADRIRSVIDPDEVTALASAPLARHLGIARMPTAPPGQRCLADAALFQPPLSQQSVQI